MQCFRFSTHVLSLCFVLVVAACFGCVPGACHASVKLTSLINSGMVLQHGQRVPIWGQAKAGSRISVHILRKQYQTTTDANGRWTLAIGPLTPGGPHRLSIRENGRLVRTLHNILIGEVWLCSGQSNMAWPLRLTTHGRQTLSHPRINDSKLRLFRVPQQISTSPKTFLTRGRWTASNAASAQHFSAVCYNFGQRLRQHRKLPVGLIQSAWGGTKIQAWIPHKALRADSRFRGIFRRHRMRRPHANSPSVLYNGMIAPVAPYGIRGALWYQGESDIYRAFMYRWSFPLLIEQWRLAWGKQFPFLYVQLAPYNYRRWRLKQGTYNELCEAQRRTLQSTFRTGMATTNDVGNIYDIHPRRKRIVAHRLYRLTRKHAYREAIVETGPLYTSFRRKGKGLLVSFQHVGKGLMAKGGTLRFFEVAGKDRRYWPAKAKIVGKQVFVWSTHVKQPVAVRFAWRDDIAHHLFNREGLPAAPFRSDRWPRITQYRR